MKKPFAQNAPEEVPQLFSEPPSEGNPLAGRQVMKPPTHSQGDKVPSNKVPSNPPAVDLLGGLNPEQRQAVQYGDGPILVLAGAGSGKTRVLTHRVAHLVLERGVYPDRILAVTFTNKATDEMRLRLRGLLGDRAERLWISTFHAAGLRILRHNAVNLGFSKNFAVYDDQDTKGVLKQVLKELAVDEEKNPLDDFVRAIDRFKNNFIAPAQAAKEAYDVKTDLEAQVYTRYQQALLSYDAMDFGDLLMYAVRVLREYPEVLEYYRHALHYILVDEFQDTNLVQYMFVRLICEPRRNLFVVGDDDQSIYGFRGASISNILEFEKDFPATHVVKLEQNYRSTANILEAAHAVIEKNTERKEKKLWTAGARGEKIRTFIGYDEDDEAEFIADEIRKIHQQGVKYSNIAILYRTNAQTRAIEEGLMKARIPYRIYGGLKFFDRKEIKDMIGYLRLVLNPADNQAFYRVVNTPPRGIGAQAVLAVEEQAKAQGCSLMRAAATVAETHKSLKKFLELMADFSQRIERVAFGAWMGYVIEKSEYGPRLAAMKDPTAYSRLENLQELQALATSEESKRGTNIERARHFLDRVTLTSSGDFAVNESVNAQLAKAAAAEGERPDVVSMMTLHLAKGLEFPVVFLGGFEEGLLPHYRSLDSESELQEERRLSYVGITRAMRVLYLTRAHLRGMFSTGGSSGSGSGARLVSRFAMDIPPGLFSAAGADRGRGAHFIDGYPKARFELDEHGDEVGGGWGLSGWRKGANRFEGSARRFSDAAPAKPERVPVSLEQMKSLLAPADTLKRGAEISKEYQQKSPAAFEQLLPEVKVVHPTFGRGVVESVKGSGAGATVVVRFEGFEEPKKLVYRFARLVLA